ncbi:leucine zipper protein 4 [Prionailurus iriomotensis]
MRQLHQKIKTNQKCLVHSCLKYVTNVQAQCGLDKRFLTMKRRREHFQKQVYRRHDQMNRNRRISPENGRRSHESDRRRERYTRCDAKALHLRNKNTSTNSSLQEPKEISPIFNFQATGHQTKLSLNERFSKLTTKKTPESVVNSEDQKVLSS